MINELELVDLWIDAIPDDNYSPCPCGCGKKFKFVKEELAQHEDNFYRKILTSKGELVNVVAQ